MICIFNILIIWNNIDVYLCLIETEENLNGMDKLILAKFGILILLVSYIQ